MKLIGCICFATLTEYLLCAQSVPSTGDIKAHQQAAPTPLRRPEEHLGDLRGGLFDRKQQEVGKPSDAGSGDLG